MIYVRIVWKNLLYSISDVRSILCESWGDNKLVHVVGGVLGYQTTDMDFFIHSTFSTKFFIYVKNLVQAKTLWKTQNLFVILEDSDAAFDKDSEYHFGFKFWASYHSKKWSFRQKMTKTFSSIWLIFWGRLKENPNYSHEGNLHICIEQNIKPVLSPFKVL
jgi:hypothetical protein